MRWTGRGHAVFRMRPEGPVVNSPVRQDGVRSGVNDMRPEGPVVNSPVRQDGVRPGVNDMRPEGPVANATDEYDTHGNRRDGRLGKTCSESSTVGEDCRPSGPPVGIHDWN